MSNIVYKVVFRDGDNLWSSSTRDKRLIVRYLPNQFVRSEFPLFAFSELLYAMHYVHPLQHPFEIWEGQAEGFLDTPAVIAASTRDAAAFWRGKNVPVIAAYRGAVLCDQLMLTKRVAFAG